MHFHLVDKRLKADGKNVFLPFSSDRFTVSTGAQMVPELQAVEKTKS